MDRADRTVTWSLRELLDGPASLREEARAEARRRIGSGDSAVEAWVSTWPDDDTPPNGALHGVPIGVKDVIDVAGVPTRCGSGRRQDAAPATHDAAIVTAWRHAGALPVGKTATTEYAYFAPGPTRNPAAPGRTPGGSSSGSAAAVAAGHVPIALGTQTAGSVARPAAYCGVAALVMSRGAFPTDGVTGLSPSLDTHGVFAAQTPDLVAAFSALTGRAPAPRPAGPSLLLWDGEGVAQVEPDMRDALARAAEAATREGAVLPFGALDATSLAAAAHPVIMAFEAAHERRELLEDLDAVSAPLRDLLLRGAGTTASHHRRAIGEAAAARTVLLAELEEHDAILAPAALGAAPQGIAATGDPVLSRPWQAMGLPAVVVPGLADHDGVPLGVQLIGRPGEDDALLALAAWLESLIRAAQR